MIKAIDEHRGWALGLWVVVMLLPWLILFFPQIPKIDQIGSAGIADLIMFILSIIFSLELGVRDAVATQGAHTSGGFFRPPDSK